MSPRGKTRICAAAVVLGSGSTLGPRNALRPRIRSARCLRYLLNVDPVRGLLGAEVTHEDGRA